VPRAAVAKLGEFAVTRAVSPLTVEAPPEDDGWVSRRHPRPKLDRSTAAKKARQLDSRLQQDGKALDPADLPPQLFAGTFVAQVELIQVVTEHDRSAASTTATPPSPATPTAPRTVPRLLAHRTLRAALRERSETTPPPMVPRLLLSTVHSAPH
jgi:hypothetical protein